MAEAEETSGRVVRAGVNEGVYKFKEEYAAKLQETQQRLANRKAELTATQEQLKHCKSQLTTAGEDY